MTHSDNIHSNRNEAPDFLRGALMWRGSVTPRIFPSLLLLTAYAALVAILDHFWRPLPHLDVTPFEYTGAVLGLVLVFRTNAGHERWWEARKLWGGINNQCRNIVIGALNYGTHTQNWRHDIVKWVVIYPFAVKESLRGGDHFNEVNDLLDDHEISALSSAVSMPLFAADKIANLIEQARYRQEMSEMAFHVLEGQRILLVDYLGGCERILKTPMPLVYAIKARRFIFIFLLLLPFSLIEKTNFNSIFIFFLVAYPLLALDRIGIELQNPFSTKNLSHLPLDTTCNSIRTNCIALLNLKNTNPISLNLGN